MCAFGAALQVWNGNLSDGEEQDCALCQGLVGPVLHPSLTLDLLAIPHVLLL